MLLDWFGEKKEKSKHPVICKMRSIMTGGGVWGGVVGGVLGCGACHHNVNHTKTVFTASCVLFADMTNESRQFGL